MLLFSFSLSSNFCLLSYCLYFVLKQTSFVLLLFLKNFPLFLVSIQHLFLLIFSFLSFPSDFTCTFHFHSQILSLFLFLPSASLVHLHIVTNSNSFIILLPLFYHLYSIFILYFLDYYPFLFIFVYFHIASDPLTSKQSKKTLSKQKTILLKIFILLIFLSDYAILQT
jgi:hypothetical protein